MYGRGGSYSHAAIQVDGGEAIAIETHSSPKILVFYFHQFIIPFIYFRTVISTHPSLNIR